MRKFFVDSEKIFDGLVSMERAQDIHHIVDVLRMNVGDKAVISDGKGNDYFTEIERIESERILFVIDNIRNSPESTVRVTLFQGVPKQNKLDDIVRKTTELGVFAINPVFMRRSVPKQGGRADGELRHKRWMRIAEEASKQAGRTLLPQINPAVSFEEALASLDAYDLLVFPYEKESFRTIKKTLIPEAKTIALFIGPEGGFDDGEANALREKGAVDCSLGRFILRTETAAVAALSMIRYHYDF